jgi:large subunit ribosomal protein L25
MAEIVTLAAAPRDRAGKGTARAARRAGQIPAVIYGNNEAPLLINVDRKTVELQLQKPGFFIHLVDVAVDGKTHRVLPRDAQYDPVSDKPLHVDFMRYSADRKITVDVPVHFTNDAASPGLKRGGVLNVVRHSVEVLCTADRIPEFFELDLTGLDIGDSIHASRLTLPEGVSFTITDRDFTIASVAAPTIMRAEEEAAAKPAEGAEAAAAPGAAAPGAAPGAAPAEAKKEPGK